MFLIVSSLPYRKPSFHRRATFKQQDTDKNVQKGKKKDPEGLQSNPLHLKTHKKGPTCLELGGRVFRLALRPASSCSKKKVTCRVLSVDSLPSYPKGGTGWRNQRVRMLSRKRASCLPQSRSWPGSKPGAWCRQEGEEAAVWGRVHNQLLDLKKREMPQVITAG